MRTTIDLPEDLLRRAKAAAALRGMKLKEFVADAIRGALAGDVRLVAERAPEYETQSTQQIAEDCTFPLIRGPGGPALQNLTPERIRRILEEEDVARARRTDPR